MFHHNTNHQLLSKNRLNSNQNLFFKKFESFFLKKKLCVHLIAGYKCCSWYSTNLYNWKKKYILGVGEGFFQYSGNSSVSEVHQSTSGVEIIFRKLVWCVNKVKRYFQTGISYRTFQLVDKMKLHVLIYL